VGSGKTFFTSKVANYFGIHTITSSSYSRIQSHIGKPNIVHCDLYRGNCSSSQFLVELESHLVEPWLLFIEWPNEILSIPNSFQYIVNIVMIDQNIRNFYIEQID
jgi:tRNA A37 threonylcarbamoyladenosine biosynthesis protein TsaE